MKTNVEKLEEKNTVLLNVEVPEEEFDKAIEQAYKSISGKLSMPGFRKGKVPRSIIDQRIGKEAVQEEAVHSALPGYYIEALKGLEIQPVDQPDIDVVQLEDGKPFVFTAKVKVKPEVKLGAYKGIEAGRPSDEPTEDEISAQIDKLRDNFASLEPVEGRAVVGGDFALIDFEGFLGDVPFEGGSANDYLLEIGSGTFIPGFEDQIIGMEKGDSRDVNVTFPEDYGKAELAGQGVKFEVTLKEIKEKKLPEINDEFARQVGFDTVDELREDIKGKVTEVKKKYADAKVKSELVDKVTSVSEIDVHDVMIERELDDMVEEYSSELVRQGFATIAPPTPGTPMVPEEFHLQDPQRTALNNYLAVAGTSFDAMRAQWRERALDTTKGRLVLEAIAKEEGIEISSDEVDAEIKKAAESMNRSFEEVKQAFEQRGTVDMLRERMTIDKTVDWLLENATVVEVESSDVEDETSDEDTASEE